MIIIIYRVAICRENEQLLFKGGPTPECCTLTKEIEFTGTASCGYMSNFVFM